ncbi:restriction endonuclease subunit S [Vibrio natriegens]|uniref:restriction endonuclease subunit S n=1 Tax=Vibrio natriegens TaxID=691 RepID=UPI00390B13B7
MVPKGWKLTSLGEVCSGSLQTGPFGSQLHAHEYTDEGVPVLMPKDLINYRANNESAAKIPEHRADDLKKHTLQSGDLLFSRRGDVARFALIESDYPRSLCGTGCLKATPNKAHSPLFLSYFLQKNAVKKWLEQNAVGQTMPNMNTAILAELPLMVASSREEEDKIAKILSTWDKAISTTEKLIETSKQQKKSLMQQLLTGKKRLVNPETGKAFEGDWEEVKLGELGQTFTGLTGKTKEDFGSGAKYIPYINIFNNSSVNIAKLEKVHVGSEEKQNVVQFGDVFFTTSSETPDEVGMSSVMLSEPEEPIYLNSFCFGFRPNDTSTIIPEFMQYLLRSSRVRRSISVLAQGATRYNLSKVQLLKINLLLPTSDEQKKIASVLTIADKEIEVLEAKLAHFKQEKKALMQQLLTGKRRVKVDEDVAA